MGRIVVVGEINMDVHMFGGSESRDRRPGEPLMVDRYLTEPGGKGANVARAVARLGVAVDLVGVVGADGFGRACLDAVAADGVGVSAVRTTPDAPTGFVAIELVDGLHRTLVYAPGANGRLEWSDVEPIIEHLRPDDVLIAQAEMAPATLARIVARTLDDGVRLFLDPAPPTGVTGDALRAAEVITPNLAEAAALTGRSDSSAVWAPLAASELRALGARCVIVKAGPLGAVLAMDDAPLWVSTLTVEAADETGAGDVFLAALAVRRVGGADWVEATRFANAASALSVSRPGLWLPTRDDVDAARDLLART